MIVQILEHFYFLSHSCFWVLRLKVSENMWDCGSADFTDCKEDEGGEAALRRPVLGCMTFGLISR